MDGLFISVSLSFFSIFFFFAGGGGEVRSFRAPKPLPILNPSRFFPHNGFLVAQALNKEKESPRNKMCNLYIYRSTV